MINSTTFTMRVDVRALASLVAYVTDKRILDSGISRNAALNYAVKCTVRSLPKQYHFSETRMAWEYLIKTGVVESMPEPPKPRHKRAEVDTVPVMLLESSHGLVSPGDLPPTQEEIEALAGGNEIEAALGT